MMPPATDLGTTGQQKSAGQENRPDDKPHLSISAHVVVQLGEELVTDVEQALLELAKNAYDADSETCDIEIDPDWVVSPTDSVFTLLADDFDSEQVDGEVVLRNQDAVPERDSADSVEAYSVTKDDSKTVGRIRIRDYGLGLSQDVLERGWLRISASLKRSKPGVPKETTKRGRTPVGDKGLGRLATMKIAEILRMKTAIEGETAWRTVAFSWAHFTQGRALEDVPVLLGTDESEPVDGPGTIVELINLREPAHWRDKSYIERHLVPNLSSLVNPFLTHDRFEISLKTRDRIHELHSLDDEVFNLASAKFSFSWDGKKLSQRAWIAPSLFRGLRGEKREDQFAKLFSDENLPALKQWLLADKKMKGVGICFEVDSPWFFSLSDDLPGAPFPKDPLFPGAVDPGPFEANLYYFMFHQNIQDKLQHAGVDAARLQAMTQVAIFRDGFRVRAQKDWLRISEGMTSGSFYGLRPNNTVGYFAVTNEKNPLLIEKSDREGFVDNFAHRGFMTLGLRCRDFSHRVLDAARISVRRYEDKMLGVSAEQDGRNNLASKARETQDKVQTGVEKLQLRLQDAQKVLAEARHIAASTKSATAVADAEKIQLAVVQAERRLAEVSGAFSDIESHVKHQTHVSGLIARLSEEDRDYAARLLEAATVGLAARALSHELHHHIRQLRDGIARVHDANKSIKNQQVTDGVRILTSTTRELGKTVAAIDPLLPGTRSIKETLDLRKFISDYVEGRIGTATRTNIELACHSELTDDGLRFRFSRARFSQVLENLFQNSLYWIQRGPLPDKNVRRIDIHITSTGFRWSDTGPGIRPSLEPTIFDAYISDKPTSEGSGLGLHVVSTFLELERCSIRLGTERNTLGRCYEFIIDLRGAQVGSEQQNLLS